MGVAGVAAVAVVVGVVSSTRGGSEGPGPGSAPISEGGAQPLPVAFVLDPLAALTVGDSVQVTTSLPDDYDGAQEWSSDAPSVASVSASGMVRGLAQGVATIALRAGGRQETVEVQVISAPRVAGGTGTESPGAADEEETSPNPGTTIAAASPDPTPTEEETPPPEVDVPVDDAPDPGQPASTVEESEPAAPPGPPAVLRIQVRPDGITSLNGVPRPDELLRSNTVELAPGRYTLQLSKPGFLPFDTIIDLSPGEEVVIRKTLVQAGSR